MRKPISAEEKLAVTLRFLATEESYQRLSFLFRIHWSTISKFVPLVCRYIYQVLKDEYLAMPSCEKDWLDIADETFKVWQFPNGIAAADGKHICIMNPAGGGSEYYIYKGFYSIVFMALVTFDYKFLYVDIGCQGRCDGGVVYVQIHHFIRI